MHHTDDLASMHFADANAVQLRITLAEIAPPVWRQLVIPSAFHLGQLHRVIQAAFNWWDYHLHEFTVGGLRFGDLRTEDQAWVGGPKLFDETTVCLADFTLRDGGAAFTYLYDFGDHWEHRVELERHLALEPVPTVARCIAGARARPPEDVGGMLGYERFLDIIADPDDEEHEDTLRWCGGHFDPEWFDLELTDKDVGRALRPGVRRRLHQLRPKRKRA